MIVIDDKYISDEVVEKNFVCNLTACKGACCVAGDCGAPLEEAELAILKKIYPKVKPYLRETGIAEIEQTGFHTWDDEHGHVTPIVNGAICAYATIDDNGLVGCGIEKAYKDGVIDFKKPISCHLYPIRITKYESFEAVNYDKWSICKPACKLGNQLQVPVYRFLEEAITRKYGAEFYAVLDKIATGQYQEEEDI
ncbi:DUF3109 domain-containing protein [Chitinophaga alhagiae]|uniref:DUF3109 domain-containing protein n=1 Tax=Chitinophaga alhagiae TaxID=2203219 RepID=A0ABN5LSW5_9BACT|nr:DUF3109 family protein [Chitinophaga alhagiae]AWO01685.1 DUF3109 domain-containing protein [Chitinophaga alhagiae]